MPTRSYIAIDLKSFYASVECRDRGLDPLNTNLIVADENRTDKTICLAVTPSLKAYGIPGRGRLFEAKQVVREVNALRRRHAPNQQFTGSSCLSSELQANPALEVDFLIAPPHMARYIEYSTHIYQIYLQYIAPEDIIVYSIDEVFIDVTDYLKTYRCTAHTLAMRIILDVLTQTGITATAGIGTNLYLAKVAMDIVAKHMPADENGVRIAELDELQYRQTLWTHRPLTDFWRIGKGYAGKLIAHGMETMGDVARCSVTNAVLLYQLFGKNAELLIDHAWGWEPCTVAAVHAYRPASNSISSGQVLQQPYTAQKARLVIREMADLLTLDLLAKGLVTNQIVLTIGYDIENLANPISAARYHGEIVVDAYGRACPKHAKGTANLQGYTASAGRILHAVSALYDRIVDTKLLVRRLTVTFCHVQPAAHAPSAATYEQLTLFADTEALQQQRAAERAAEEREQHIQQAILEIKTRFGKNAIFKGMNLEEGATARSRNAQIGGHKA